MSFFLREGTVPDRRRADRIIGPYLEAQVLPYEYNMSAVSL